MDAPDDTVMGLERLPGQGIRERLDALKGRRGHGYVLMMSNGDRHDADGEMALDVERYRARRSCARYVRGAIPGAGGGHPLSPGASGCICMGSRRALSSRRSERSERVSGSTFWVAELARGPRQ